MIFSETKLPNAYTIDIDKKEDERGFFARTWDKNEFLEKGLDSKFVQFSISHNNKKGTIRGMHYQDKPFEENKIVTCTKGRIFDVIIDLRPKSKTFKKWFSVELSSYNYKMLYIPKGFAHGFQTMEDNTEIMYYITEYFNKNFSRGVLWNDSAFQISWPLRPTVISKKDQSYEKFVI